jgi:hypothetical protein
VKNHKPESEHGPSVAAGSPYRLWPAGLLVLLGMAGVILFVTIQNRIRTRQSLGAWQNLRAELEAKGESLAWETFRTPCI